MPGPQIQASRADRNIRPWSTVCTHGAVIFRRKLHFLQFGGTCTITGGHLTPSTIPRNVSYSEPVSYPQRLATYTAPSKSHQVNRHSKKPKVHTLLFNVRRAINNAFVPFRRPLLSVFRRPSNALPCRPDRKIPPAAHSYRTGNPQFRTKNSIFELWGRVYKNWELSGSPHIYDVKFGGRPFLYP